MVKHVLVSVPSTDIKNTSKSCVNISLILNEKKKTELVAFERHNSTSYFYIERPRSIAGASDALS